MERAEGWDAMLSAHTGVSMQAHLHTRACALLKETERASVLRMASQMQNPFVAAFLLSSFFFFPRNKRNYLRSPYRVGDRIIGYATVWLTCPQIHRGIA